MNEKMIDYSKLSKEELKELLKQYEEELKLRENATKQKDELINMVNEQEKLDNVRLLIEKREKELERLSKKNDYVSIKKMEKILDELKELQKSLNNAPYMKGNN